ncbi:MAG: cobyrinate a,c-diamide synthase [Desulfobacteraceae bacterium]
MPQQNIKVPGLAIAGLRGGTGKTVISLGITAAWREQGLRIAPFKKGPDYIDAGWLAQAAGRPCYNLDTFCCPPNQVKASFLKNSVDSDISLVEGNRGLYDCIDVQGETSTAEIAKFLKIPLLLVVDCTKSTRTIAALVMGCTVFDPDLDIMGIVLNRVAGKRHEGKVRDNIERYCRLPVYGAVPKLKAEDFPERHMGLVPSAEHSFTAESIKAAAKFARENIDLDRLYTACHETVAPDSSHRNVLSREEVGPAKTAAPEHLSVPAFLADESQVSQHTSAPVIGVIKDSAFQFYYPDNLEALESRGAVLEFISPLMDTTIPEVDAIYMGGGFPETHAAKLSENLAFRQRLKQLAEKGLPIYAECGGLMFLGRSLTLDNRVYPMANILPIAFGLSEKPVGHGYTRVTVVNANPFFPEGLVIHGHEFRYSTILDIDFKGEEMAFRMDRGKGIVDKQDGFTRKNVFATYTHLLAPGVPSWAEALVNRAAEYKRQETRNKR